MGRKHLLLLHSGKATDDRQVSCLKVNRCMAKVASDRRLYRVGFAKKGGSDMSSRRFQTPRLWNLTIANRKGKGGVFPTPSQPTRKHRSLVLFVLGRLVTCDEACSKRGTFVVLDY